MSIVLPIYIHKWAEIYPKLIASRGVPHRPHTDEECISRLPLLG